MNVGMENRSANSPQHLYRATFNHLWEFLTLDRRWLWLYLLALGLGVLGDLSFCILSPLQVFWVQMLPNLNYIGIVFAGITFGAWGGLAAAGIVGIAHASITATACAYPAPQPGQMAMFAAVGLLAGWIAKRRVNVAVEPETAAPNLEERSRDRPLSELGRMLPGLVHQFRTPIASIEGAGSVLEDAELSDDKRQEFARIIHKECRRLDLLVGLLDFTQPRASDYREVDVTRMLDEVVQLCGSRRGGSTIAVRNSAGPDLPRLRCDPELIKQAVLNLTTNAIHAMPQGGEVVLWARSTTGQMIIGLTDQRIDNRTEHLYRLFDGASLSYESSEVDLAIVQQIVNRHGGTIRVEPNASRGVTISLILSLQR